MTVVVGFDIHRAQVTYDALDDVTGEVKRGRIAPADRTAVRRFLASLPAAQVEVALEATTGWRFIVEELVAAGAIAHLAEPAETANLRGRRRGRRSTVRTRVICASYCSRVGCRRRGRRPRRSSSCASGCDSERP
jgi:hypothetical protein